MPPTRPDRSTNRTVTCRDVLNTEFPAGARYINLKNSDKIICCFFCFCVCVYVQWCIKYLSKSTDLLTENDFGRS